HKPIRCSRGDQQLQGRRCRLTARRDVGEPVEHELVRLALAGRVAVDGGEEMAPVERTEPERRSCAHGCHAWRVMKQGHLAKAIAGTHGADQAVVADHVDLAVFDYIEAIAVVALAEDCFTRGNPDIRNMHREVVDRRQRQRAKHFDARENFDLLISVRDPGVDCVDTLPAKSREHGSPETEHDEGATDPEQIDDERSDERADGYRQPGQARLYAEHTAEQLLRDKPRGQRVQADVTERIPESDHQHQAQYHWFVWESSGQG